MPLVHGDLRGLQEGLPGGFVHLVARGDERGGLEQRLGAVEVAAVQGVTAQGQQPFADELREMVLLPEQRVHRRPEPARDE